MSRLSLCLALLLPFSWADARARPSKRPTISFATVEEGRKILTTRDDFVVRLSPFDRAARVGTDKHISEAEYLRFVSGNVLAWTPEDKTVVQAAWSALEPKLDQMALPFPATIYLIKTTGREEGGAEYTRANAIVLPQPAFDASHRGSLESILAHELFHVLSRSNPELRDKLYRVIGFEPCGEIPFPTELASRKITNPDAPKNDHSIRLQTSGGAVWAVPILFSRTPRYDPAQRGPFFNYLEFKLLVVERAGSSPTAPASYDAARPILLDVNQVSGFYEQVGRNTDYIIHPEEILADNFKLLLLGETNVPSPDILRRLAAVLGQSGAAKQ
jgi:hypothetical protein